MKHRQDSVVSHNPAFQLLLQHSDGGEKRKKRIFILFGLLFIALIFLVLTVVLLIVKLSRNNTAFLTEDEKLSKITFLNDSNSISSFNGNGDFLLLLGGRTLIDHRYTSSVEIIGTTECANLPRTPLGLPSEYVKEHDFKEQSISTITESGKGQMVTCLQFVSTIDCKSYDGQDWQPNANSRNEINGSLVQDFNGIGIRDSLILFLRNENAIQVKAYNVTTSEFVSISEPPFSLTSVLGSCYVVIETLIYKIGGLQKDSREVVSTVELFEFQSQNATFNAIKVPKMIYGRKMAGCAKIMHGNSTAIIVAGGQNSRGHGKKMRSVEMLKLNQAGFPDAHEWVQLPDLNYARSHFPSVGFIGSSLIVAGGRTDSTNAEKSIEKYENARWIIDTNLRLNQPKYGHSTVQVSKDWCLPPPKK